MIFDTLASADRYAPLHPLFPRAFEYLRGTDLKALPPGRYPIEGEGLFAIVETVAGRSHSEAKLECHRKYIDIQLVLEGVDEMGWKPVCNCQAPLAGYNPEKDIQFFHDTLVSDGEIRKVILKIAVM